MVDASVFKEGYDLIEGCDGVVRKWVKMMLSTVDLSVVNSNDPMSDYVVEVCVGPASVVEVADYYAYGR